VTVEAASCCTQLPAVGVLYDFSNVSVVNAFAFPEAITGAVLWMGNRAVVKVGWTPQQLAVAEVRPNRLIVEAAKVTILRPVSKGASNRSC